VFEFWWGKQRTVSLCDIDMFKAVKHLPDRPPQSFENFIPLIGKQSIQLTNGEEYLRRREKLHKPVLNIHAIHQNLIKNSMSSCIPRSCLTSKLWLTLPEF
jgi:hypothetical protein